MTILMYDKIRWCEKKYMILKIFKQQQGQFRTHTVMLSKLVCNAKKARKTVKSKNNQEEEEKYFSSK